MDERERPVSELGESELVRRIISKMDAAPPGETWSGDDAASVRLASTRQVVTTDAIVEGVDFDRSYATGYDVGWKAIAINASDIAAMGAAPSHAVATLSLPGSSTLGFVDDLTDGLVEAGRSVGVSIVGGDVGEASEISLSVAMTGVPVADSAILRSGAAPGDRICVTGSLGGARAGLMALRASLATDHPELVARQLRPTARVREAAALAPLGPSAMIDVSDGLARDLWRLVEASGVGCEIDEEAIPVDAGLAVFDGIEDPIESAIIGGEDFELLFTIRAESVPAAIAAVAATGTDVTFIGTITEGARRIGDGSLEDWKERGWDHLRVR